ncbi:protein of unknown function [Taphrina deformans PYCC 5710]|uniref:SCP domain-containing protein n=1 Tax=Taphrina deformans (strain PYCC 5710 / ATCC 11124 / CBS 356.35 / IMI 108563 / JCM 9778 / NBRC 8474) TaxID=1097556 RepID=R4X6J5_TAPDE|nr:protein of unknown function [Taphrina deformans PYCC 5710]|eukprot:CCG80506.1 protein of unknown function [Taphrina deformans PYCC 5710]
MLSSILGGSVVVLAFLQQVSGVANDGFLFPGAYTVPAAVFINYKCSIGGNDNRVLRFNVNYAGLDTSVTNTQNAENLKIELNLSQLMCGFSDGFKSTHRPNCNLNFTTVRMRFGSLVLCIFTAFFHTCSSAPTTSAEAELDTKEISHSKDASPSAFEQSKNVGNQNFVQLSPVWSYITWSFNCPSFGKNKIQTEDFYTYIEWLAAKRKLQYSRFPDGHIDAIGGTRMYGPYPYWSTAIFEHRKCVTTATHACAYYFKGQVVTSIRENLIPQGVGKWGLGYFEPVVAEHCVLGNECNTNGHVFCDVTRVESKALYY